MEVDFCYVNHVIDNPVNVYVSNYYLLKYLVMYLMYVFISRYIVHTTKYILRKHSPLSMLIAKS